jgi:drug/metabolite transporter (DMT)-like permease
VDSVVFVAVIGAAILHATWNALIKSSGDRVVSLALQDGVMLCFGLVLIIFVAPIPDSRAFPYIAGSAGILIFYRIFLLKAYRHGDFGRSYPIARGTAPLLVACAGVLIGDDVLSLYGYGAIALISIGIIGLVFSKKYSGGNRLDRGFIYALACGCMIAGYSVVDSRGVRLADTAVGYYACLSIISCSWLPTYVLATKGSGIFPAFRVLGGRALISGSSSGLGYLIVVWAYSQTSAVQVVALRETSVVFGAIIGAYILKEGLGPRRVTCSLLVASGVIFLLLYQ